MTTTALTSKIGRQDINSYNGVSTTFTRRTSVGGTLTLTRLGNTVDVCEVYGNNTTRTSAIIKSAVSTIGSTNIVGLDFGVGSWAISVDTAISSNMICVVPPGGSFAITTGKILTLGSQIEAGSYRIFTGAGKVAFSAGSIIKTSWFGGIVNTLSYLSGTPDINVIFDMNETIAANLTITDNIRVSSPFGYVVTINNGVTLTISGEMDAGNPLTFNLVGTGNVDYGTTTYSYTYVYPQIWGAVGDGTADDTIAVQACFDNGYDLNVPIYLPPGTYKCGALTYGSNTVGAESDCAPEMYGTGSASIIKAKTGVSGVFISAKNIKNKILRDFVIDATDIATITEVINTDWYVTGAALNNVYRNIRIINYPVVAWSAEYNGSCVWDQIVVTDPTTSTNQKALDIVGDAINLNNCSFDGYILATADNLKIDGSYCWGLSATADTVTIVNSQIKSNSVTSACINGTIDCLAVVGGTLTTVAGRNHLKGTYDAGGVLSGVTFDGQGGENIFHTSINGSVGTPAFVLNSCINTGNAVLNYNPSPAGIKVVLNSYNTGVKTLTFDGFSRQVFTTPGTATYTKPTNCRWIFVEVTAGGGGGSLHTADIGSAFPGAGGGYACELIDAINITTKSYTVGAAGTGRTSTTGNGTAGGTSSFDSYCSAAGGGAGTTSAAGTGGAGTGGDINLTGGDGKGVTSGSTDRHCFSGAGAGPYGGSSRYQIILSGVGQSGEVGINYGGGGTGGYSSGQAGGNGAPGIVVVWEFY